MVVIYRGKVGQNLVTGKEGSHFVSTLTTGGLCSGGKGGAQRIWNWMSA